MSNNDSNNEKINAEGYELFKRNVLEQLPNPYFCQKEEEKQFLGLKLEYPEASKYENTGMGTAICLDSTARMILAYRMIQNSKNCAYIVESILMHSLNMEAEEVIET